MKMLKLLALVIFAHLCLSQDPGDYDYIACNDCQIPEGEFPKEGQTTCFAVKTEMKPVKGKIWQCTPGTVCGEFDIFCVPQKEKCEWVEAIIAVPTCKLERKINYKPIEHRDNFYQIHSPRYHGYNDYTNNTYCVWNVADSGYVSYQIIDLQLQEPLDCNATGCKCPDSVKISKGANEETLCGTQNPNDIALLQSVSSNGLHVEFCSDNKHTAKGFHMLAATLDLETPTDEVNKDAENKDAVNKDTENKDAENKDAVNKREITAQERPQEVNDDSSKELDHVTCQYEYMMRISQPDVPCPDDRTIKAMLEYHHQLMSNDEKCNGMAYPSTMMPMMNKLERCAVEYLYRSGDCEYAKTLADTTSGELHGIARAFAENDFKRPKWGHNGRRKCRNNDDE